MNWFSAYMECLSEGREVHEFSSHTCYYCRPGWLCPDHHQDLMKGMK